MPRRWILAALCLALLAPAARADDDPQPSPATIEIEELPGIDIVAPRVEGSSDSAGRASTVTVLRRDALVFDVPSAVSVRDRDELINRRMVRSMPDALRALPGVLIQKTAPGQGSPFIRGFTAYHNLLLVDGVRLNHSAMRSGPNQYWSTIDPYTMGRLEVVRGPHSVLYGSDAVGGTVNVLSNRRTDFSQWFDWDTRVMGRVASGERSGGGRIEFEGNRGRLGWFGGISGRSFGDIESGAGRLPGTGDWHEFGADLRFDHHFSRAWTFTLAGQQFTQDDVPRTERTIFAVPYAGTSVGSELRRDHDQDRTLIYARANYHGGGYISKGHATLSWHRHQEERDRLRTADRQDLSGFENNQIGLAVQMESRTRIGRFTYGAEWYHDEVDSFRRNFVGGVEGTPGIQGPVGDDASYDLIGVYVQDHWSYGRWDLIAGLRFNYARAEANRVDNPAVPGSDPSTPGNIIKVENDWTKLVGSLKAMYRINKRWRAYGGVSQGFRAPTLHDLTSLDSTSVVETPSPDLEAEDYVQFELGAKTEQRRFSADAAVWYTLIDNAIIRSPTGVLIGGVPEVRKDNIGDGWAWGVEASAAFRMNSWWTAYGNLGWMDSEVKEFDAATGALVDSPLSRNNPFHSLLGLRLEPQQSRGWLTFEWEYADKADQLSLRDKSDTRRIPPGGTPSWSIVNIRGGFRFGEKSSLSLAIENLFDENYRTHGSGQNEPGRSLVFGFTLEQ